MILDALRANTFTLFGATTTWAEVLGFCSGVLYIYKDLWLTAILCVGFMALCVLGLRAWLTDYRTRVTAAVGSPA